MKFRFKPLFVFFLANNTCVHKSDTTQPTDHLVIILNIKAQKNFRQKFKTKWQQEPLSSFVKFYEVQEIYRLFVFKL